MRETRKVRGRARTAVIAGALTACAMAVICAAQSPVSGAAAGSRQTGLQASTTSGMQTGSPTPASVGGNSPLGAAGRLDEITSPFPDASRLKRNDERQRRLVSDTQKLLALTSQLKAEVASTGAESMSPEMLKQMDEIEKLAKSVKDKMRD